MELDATERAGVAAFFAKRFPTEEERNELCAKAGLPVLSAPTPSAQAGWERVLAVAERKGRLGRLARTAVAAAPEDDNLARAAALLGRGELGLNRWMVALGAVSVPAAALLLSGVVAWGVGAFEPSAAEAAPSGLEVTSAVPETPDAPSTLPDPPLEAPPVEAPAGVDTPVTAPPVAEEPRATQPPVPARRSPEGTAGLPVHEGALARAATTGAANHAGRCTQSGGGLVGWYWAGAQSPGSAGDVITIPRDLNVRAWAPTLDNGFDLRGPVRCVLVEGDRLRLSESPVRVPGDAVWVPVFSGDVLE